MPNPSDHEFSDPALQGRPEGAPPAGDEYDPDLAPPGHGVEADTGDAAPIAEGDLLAQAEAAMAAPLTKPPLVLEVAGRPGFTVEYDVNIPEPELRVYETRATSGRRGQEKLDGLAFACILVANRARAITYQGQLLEDDGARRTFSSKKMHRLYNVDGARQAVRKFLGDPGADAHADAILAAAGFGERARTVDPTQGL